jgi:hypothetical protein
MNLVSEPGGVDFSSAPPTKVRFERAKLTSQFTLVSLAGKLVKQLSLCFGPVVSHSFSLIACRRPPNALPFSGAGAARAIR